MVVNFLPVCSKALSRRSVISVLPAAVGPASVMSNGVPRAVDQFLDTLDKGLVNFRIGFLEILVTNILNSAQIAFAFARNCLYGFPPKCATLSSVK